MYPDTCILKLTRSGRHTPYCFWVVVIATCAVRSYQSPVLIKEPKSSLGDPKPGDYAFSCVSHTLTVFLTKGSKPNHTHARRRQSPH